MKRGITDLTAFSELDRNRVGQLLEKAIRLMVMLLPVLLLFGIHAVFIKIQYIGFITAQNIYGWLIAILTAVYFIVIRRFTVHLGRAFWFSAFLLIMLAYALISIIWVINKGSSFDDFVYQFSGVGAALYMVAVFRNLDDLKNFLRVLTVCYIIIVAISVFEIYTGIYFFQPSPLSSTLRDEYGFNFPYTVFYNTNDNASFLAMFSPFAVFTLINWAKGLTGKVAGVILSVMAFFALIAGRARNSFLTIICFLAVLLIVCIAKKSLRKYAKTLAAIFFSLPLAVVLITVTAYKRGSILTKISTINSSDHSIGERFEMTLGGLRMAAAYHFLGVGVGNSVPLMPYFSSLSPINLHDMPLQIFVEYGIIIFVLYVAATVFLARDFLKFRSESDKQELFSLLCFLTILAFQVVGLQSSDSMHILALWLLFGIWLSAEKLFYKERDNLPLWIPHWLK
jgi:hypothetical protein